MSQRLHRRLAVAAICLSVLAGGHTLRSQSAELKEFARKSLAQIDGELPVPGLQKDVQVIRDTRGGAGGVEGRQAVDEKAAHRLKLTSGARPSAQ